MRRLLGAVVLVAAACAASGTRRVPIDEDDNVGGAGIESADIEAMEALAASILTCPALTGPTIHEIPVVAIHPVENDTDIDFDTELFVRRIRAELGRRCEGRLKFVVRNRQEALVDRERLDKRDGEYTSTKQATKTGADYYLTGIAATLSKATREHVSRAMWVDFQLIDAENGEIIWEDTYKTKKVSTHSAIYR
ncbi:MAG: hypothetical protein ACYTGN_02085 [Planctomycetota bacterium]|jgi:PBP1b-binding outer membrane lipoprotein LpoB